MKSGLDLKRVSKEFISMKLRTMNYKNRGSLAEFIECIADKGALIDKWTFDSVVHNDTCFRYRRMFDVQK